jgi:hypothetical protein
MVYFMESPHGLWVYDENEKEITKTIYLTGDKPSIQETLEMLLNEQSGFTASNGKSYSNEDNLYLFFFDYIPRVYNFVPTCPIRFNHGLL